MPGTLLYAGATDFKCIGRSPVKEEEGQKYPNLYAPHFIKTLVGVKIAFVGAGPAAAHCLAVDDAGRLYTWGRNETGQLGHGTRGNMNTPTIVEALKGHVVTCASGGKFHTLVCTAKREAFAWGSNKHGQLGAGSLRLKGADDDLVVSLPVKSVVADVDFVSAGAEFSAWLCEGGELWTAGNPQYGQLGHGSDHEYNMKEGSVKLAYMPQPTPKRIMGALKDAKVTKVAAGLNHTVCIDAAGKIYTWGNGGYGRLGHKEQKDEFSPRQVAMQGGDRNACPPDAICAAGSNSSWVSAAQGQIYYWGKIKTSGDNQMYPKAYMDLSGWSVRTFMCGANTFAVTSETSTVTWGGAQYGELAYGVGGKKSSASADKVHALEGLTNLMATPGVGQMLFLIDEKDAEKLAAKNFPVWTPPEDEPEAETFEDEGEGSGGKRKGKGPAGKAAKKGK